MLPWGSVRRSLLAAFCLGTIVLSVQAVERTPPPTFLEVQSTAYRDLDGDGDMFPDTGETGRLVLTLRNTGPALTGVILKLSTSDPDVDCIQSAFTLAGDLSAGQVVTVGSLDPLEPGFTFKASDTMQTTSPTAPAHIDLCLRFAALEYTGFSKPTCFTLAADLDLPTGATQTFIAGPDGVSPSPDDGTLLENFDVDRDGDGDYTVNDTFLTTDEGTGLTSHGFYLRGAAANGMSTVRGIACGGFVTLPLNPACILDPDYPMDWHFHCPAGATDCPNLESGTCVGGCSYANDVPKALSPPNSLHMGAHFHLHDADGDTTHLRTIQGFVSAPVNLAAFARPGDLVLSFFEIVRLMDNNFFVGGYIWDQCADCADVQIQVDNDPSPDIDTWGYWDKLLPYQNVYDHRPMAYSALSPYYCQFTPADTGGSPPNPHGYHETLCFPQGAWSSCGSATGITTTSGLAAPINYCPGPGVVDPSGKGLWIETRFSLAPYLGQRVRIRWIGSSWVFDETSSSYYEAGAPWNVTKGDDGWWLDDIRITGAITRQLSPLPDTRPSPGSSCPVERCADTDGDVYAGPSIPPCPADVPLDCDDADPEIFPNAWEVNDGRDNQCPGDAGFGLVDELSGEPSWNTDGTYLYIILPFQPGAVSYELAVADRRDFSNIGFCSLKTIGDGIWTRTGTPPPGEAFYYLGRSLTPHTGSWGRASSGTERQGVCGS